MTDFTEQNTKSLQLASLDSFAAALGCARLPIGSSSYFAINEHGVKLGYRGADCIGFNTMVMLHSTDWITYPFKRGYNIPVTDFFGNGNCLKRFVTNGYALNKALSARIVTQVFLRSNNSGVVTCHKHLVKFVNTSYQYLFLKGE